MNKTRRALAHLGPTPHSTKEALQIVLSNPIGESMIFRFTSGHPKFKGPAWALLKELRAHRPPGWPGQWPENKQDDVLYQHLEQISEALAILGITVTKQTYCRSRKTGKYIQSLDVRGPSKDRAADLLCALSTERIDNERKQRRQRGGAAW